MVDKKYGYYLNGKFYGLWILQREFTKHWGCSNLLKRVIDNFGKPDICFGKTDGIPNDIKTVDINKESNPTFCFDWKDMDFKDNQFNFGFWDPPYDKMYMPEYREIWRVCKKLAVLHIFCYPSLPLQKQIATVGVIYGPMKQIRLLGIFQKESTLEKWI